MTELATLSAKELVAIFNASAFAADKISEWKGSKAQLIAKINALKPVEVPTAKPVATTAGVKAKAEKAMDKLVKSQEAAATKRADAAKPRNAMSDYLAANPKANGKVLRAKLRKLGHNAPYTAAQIKQAVA